MHILEGLQTLELIWWACTGERTEANIVEML